MLELCGRMAPAVSEAMIEAARGRQERQRTGGAIARIPIYGTIQPKADIWTLFFGGAAIDMLTAEFRAALADPDVKGILLDIDSPGGTIYGVPELAREIRAARGQKPILAVASPEAASAAYYLGAQADEFSITPSGQVGSLGVVYLHTDLTGMAEQQGIQFTIFRSSDRKADINPYESLSDEAAADIQAKVNAYNTMFERDVARGRGVSVEKVRKDYGQGAMFLAADALKAGVVDRIETVDEGADRLARGSVVSRSAPAADSDPAPAPIEVPNEVLRVRVAALAEIAATRAKKEATPCPV